jgi:hypothetical protein
MTKHEATESTFLDAAAILAIDDIDTETVFVPEWKTSVRVRAISAAERENLMRGSVVIEGKTRRFDAPQMRVKLAALAMVDADGKRLFSNHQVEALGRKSAKAIDRVAEVAMRLAGMEDDEPAGDQAPLPPSASSNTD